MRSGNDGREAFAISSKKYKSKLRCMNLPAVMLSKILELEEAYLCIAEATWYTLYRDASGGRPLRFKTLASDT